MSAPDPGAALREVLDAATEPARVIAPAFGKAKGGHT